MSLRDHPLTATLHEDCIVIRIGIDTLAHAAHSGPFTEYSERKSEYVQSWTVTDPIEFAHDVCRALTREAEDGSSALTDLLDSACVDAMEDGSAGVEGESVT